MIERGDIKPLIVVAATFDNENEVQDFARSVEELSVFHNDLIKYFLPLSGDCWIMGTYGGRYRPEETADRLEQIIREKRYTASDYEIYAAVGTRDPIWDQVNNRLTEMLTRSTFSGGNVRYAVKEGGRHDYEAIAEYLTTHCRCTLKSTPCTEQVACVLFATGTWLVIFIHSLARYFISLYYRRYESERYSGERI